MDIFFCTISIAAAVIWLIFYNRIFPPPSKANPDTPESNLDIFVKGGYKFTLSEIPIFYQIDEDEIDILYNIINQERFIKEKSNSSWVGEGKIEVSGFSLSISRTKTEEGKFTQLERTEKYLICLMYFHNKNKLFTTLESIDPRSTEFFQSIDESDDFIPPEAIRTLKDRVLQKYIDSVAAKHDEYCLLTKYPFTITKVAEDEYELIYCHSIGKQPGQQITVTVYPIPETITKRAQSWNKNIGGTLKLTVFGKMKIINQKDKSWKIEIYPLAIS